MCGVKEINADLRTVRGAGSGGGVGGVGGRGEKLLMWHTYQRDHTTSPAVFSFQHHTQNKNGQDGAAGTFKEERSGSGSLRGWGVYRVQPSLNLTQGYFFPIFFFFFFFYQMQLVSVLICSSVRKDDDEARFQHLSWISYYRPLSGQAVNLFSHNLFYIYKNTICTASRKYKKLGWYNFNCHGYFKGPVIGWRAFQDLPCLA